MSQNFFQSIGFADMEKVHSAVIAWMLSENCNAFDIKAKSILLCQLFGEPFSTFHRINVYVETHNLDILFVTENEKKEKIYWVIENKIKSSQRKNQLNDYVATLTKIAGLCKKKYCFLSLISEEPQCNCAKWHSSTYGQLADYIEWALKSGNVDEKDYYIVSDYHDYIRLLDIALEDFLRNPQSFPNVFTDGPKRKEDKILEDNNFIGKHNLETIFQKCYLKRILHDLDAELCEETAVNETRGTALIDFLSVKIMPNGLESHIQIQNGSFKVFLCMINDKNSNKDTFLDDWLTIFEELKQKHSHWHINLPKSKPSISLSRLDKKWYISPYNDIVKRWKKLYDECRDIQAEIEKSVKGKNQSSIKS